VAKLSIRVDLGDGQRLGPGKIRLLKHIEATGSIAAAGRAMEMSYRRAWLLVEELNQMFKAPVIEPQTGGTKGGGARLTLLGREIIERYVRIEKSASAASKSEITAIARLCRS
jgi:molybdate transport system regulatory protein